MRASRKGFESGGFVVLVCLCLLFDLSSQARQQSATLATDLIQQGRNLLRDHNLLQAKEVLEKAVSLTPGSVDAWTLLAAAYSQLGLEEELSYGKLLSQHGEPGRRASAL